MARLYLTSTNKMAQNLGRDMRQGPLECACHLGFDSTNYNNKCKKRNTTTIQSRIFAGIYLHLTKKSHSKTLVVIPSTKSIAKNSKKKSSFNKHASIFQPITLRRAQILDLTKW
jgi:hypothetical protein